MPARVLVPESARVGVGHFMSAARAFVAQRSSQSVLVCAVAAVTVVGGGIALMRRCRKAARLAIEDDESIVPAFHKLLRPTAARARTGLTMSTSSGQVAQIVLTGGPMGGKATLASRLRRVLRERGWHVLIAPSVPALLFNSGLDRPSKEDAVAILEFEVAVLELQHQLEGSFKRAATASGTKTAIIYDRGVLDVAAFLPREYWPELAARASLSLRPRDWYKAIVHLVSAADGAQKTFAAQVRDEHAAGGRNGNIDSHVEEAIREALHIDALVGEVQGMHPNYLRIDNTTGFEAKMQRAVDAVVGLVERA